ncbi:hypothetical protein HYW46_07110 [Candidatus Daviesbacteria bacterium]|nr:hypothetical protein [Candidatus Daviesbacteria bacterium]
MKECLGVLISGSGTTMAAILRAYNMGELNLDIGCVISSNPNAEGIKKARIAGIDPKNIVCLNPKLPQFPEELLKNLQKRNVTVVTQNGWMPKTPEMVIEAYKDRIFNQHPGPAPEFGGKGMFGIRVHLAVLLFRRLTGRDLWTEVIAQRVDKEFDQGVIVRRKRVDILPTDTAEDLQQRCLPFEHQVQIELLKHVVGHFLWEYPKHAQTPLFKNQKEKKLLEFCKKAAIKAYPNARD